MLFIMMVQLHCLTRSFGLTAKTNPTLEKNCTPDILTQAANTDMHMSMHHDRIRSTKVE
ncbi:unnamed protein product, partial [Ectocarpus sp. 13 AM-2016]